MASTSDGGVLFMRMWSPVKLVAWALLSLAVTTQAVACRNIRSRGWQLNRAIVILCWLFLGASCAEMAAVFAPSARRLPALGTMLAFSSLSDAFFLGLLMAISAGFCITRPDLGPSRLIIVAVPLLYIAATVTVEGIALAEVAHAHRRNGSLSSVTSAALVACGVLLRLAAIAVAWVFVFTSVRDERSRLAVRCAQFAAADVFKLEDETDSPQLAAQRVVAQAQRAIPRSAAAMNANSMAVSSSILASQHQARGEAEVGGPERVKSSLLRGFNRGVTVYAIVVAATAVFGVASFQFGEFMAAVRDCARWAFLLCLAVLFRPREQNPYLLLVDDYRFDDVHAHEWRVPMASRPTPAAPLSGAPSASVRGGMGAMGGGQQLSPPPSEPPSPTMKATHNNMHAAVPASSDPSGMNTRRSALLTQAARPEV